MGIKDTTYRWQFDDHCEYVRRGTGRTTRQLLELPEGGIFFAYPTAVPYTRNLCYRFGRLDITVRPFSMNSFRNICLGSRVPFAIDHVVWNYLPLRNWHEVFELMAAHSQRQRCPNPIR